MKPLQVWQPLFSVKKPGKKGINHCVQEQVDDIEARITESPLARNREFKALDLNGVTLSYDADEVHILHNGDVLTYVSVMGNLIVLYDHEEDLNGFWFAAESIQKIQIKKDTQNIDQES